MRPNFDRIMRENNNHYNSLMDDMDEFHEKEEELRPIFEQIANILTYEYLEKKNMVVTMVSTIEGIRVIYVAGRNEEEYVLAIYLKKNDEKFVNIYGEKVNPFESSLEVSAIALMNEVKVFNVCFNIFTENREDEDIVGRFYANNNRYYYSAPYGVLAPIHFEPMEDTE